MSKLILRLLKRVGARRLSVQMTAVVMALFMFTVISLSMLGRRSMEDELLGITQRYTLQILDQVNQNINYYISDMESIAQIANSQSEILSLLFEDVPMEFNRSSYYHRSQAVRQLLHGISIIRDEMVDIIIVGENGAVSDIVNNYYTKFDTDLTETSWYKAAIAADGNSVFTPPYIRQNNLGQSVPVISIAKAISMYSGGHPLGVILIELRLEALEKICSTVSLHQSGYIFVTDRSGNFIYHPNEAYISPRVPVDTDQGLKDQIIAQRVLAGEETFVVGQGSERRYVIGRQLESSQWMVVGVVPYDEIFASALEIGQTQITIGIAAALFVAVLIALVLARMIFAPLNRLKLLMGTVEKGDFDVEVPVGADNEIGQLSRSFNIMTKQIKQLMRSSLQTEKEKRRAELTALYAQINPHFLYNTLDAIVWMAEYNPPEAAKMAEALAKLFRLALGKGSDIATIEQEMEYVKHYLSIQNMRYKSKFEYRVDYEQEVAGQKIPKLVVQVLVENAIYHGIKPKRKKCLLLVRAMRQGDEVIVQVVDDGVGASGEKLKEIFSSDYAPNKAWGGIGVKNVRERVRLYFGAGYGLEYYSIPTVGTLAEISIPFDPDAGLHAGD